eukprot:m.132935 g.132935  ORF g.132935 m.132935 type:complete len:357 (+) comp20083_c0_seq1:3-1073(+)
MDEFLASYSCSCLPQDALGKGKFGRVFRCHDRQTGNILAAKVVPLEQLSQKDRDSMHREIQVVRHLQHDNIVHFHAGFHDLRTCVGVFDLVEGGELFEEILLLNHYSERDARNLVQQVLSAAAYCHSQGIVHRDIKPENILLANTLQHGKQIKLIDFGLAMQSQSDWSFRGFCGTILYMSPEIILQKPYDSPVDVWSIGVIFYILLCGFPPFSGDDDADTMLKITELDFDFPSPNFDEVCMEAKDLIVRMFQSNATHRITAEACLQHDFFTKQEMDISGFSRRSTMEELRKFNARRKLKACMQAVRASTALQRQVLMKAMRGGPAPKILAPALPPHLLAFTQRFEKQEPAKRAHSS